jgi:phosphopantothenoylcysteine decarboxylase/phosphopantothenate--cysteine ligase
MEHVVSNPLADREIVIAVGGGIAAYKVAAVTSGLVQRSAHVSVVMTRNSQKFIV